MKHWISIVARICIGIIFLQTLYFKFTAAPESVFIFSSLGIEPWGRIFAGVSELVTVLLLALPATVWLGGVMSVFTMAGALLAHLFVIGIEVDGDGGLLFFLALLCFVGGSLLVYFEKEKLISLTKSILSKLKK